MSQQVLEMELIKNLWKITKDQKIVKVFFYIQTKQCKSSFLNLTNTTDWIFAQKVERLRDFVGVFIQFWHVNVWIYAPKLRGCVILKWFFRILNVIVWIFAPKLRGSVILQCFLPNSTCPSLNFSRQSWEVVCFCSKLQISLQFDKLFWQKKKIIIPILRIWHFHPELVLTPGNFFKV